MTNEKTDPYAARTYDAPPQTWANVARADVREFLQLAAEVPITMVQNGCCLLGVLLRAAAGASQLLRITLFEKLRQGALAGVVQV